MLGGIERLFAIALFMGVATILLWVAFYVVYWAAWIGFYILTLPIRIWNQLRWWRERRDVA